MQTSAIRVEVIRFSLLVTLTVALLSVAIRLASHNDAHTSSHSDALPPGSSAPSTSSTSGTTPSSSPSSTATPAPVPSGTASFAPRGSSSGGGAGSGGAGGQPVLPVTGDDALKLIAMSLVLIGGGALTVRASRR